MYTAAVQVHLFGGQVWLIYETIKNCKNRKKISKDKSTFRKCVVQKIFLESFLFTLRLYLYLLLKVHKFG